MPARPFRRRTAIPAQRRGSRGHYRGVSAQRGFSLIEVLIATAIASLLAVFIVRATTSALHTLSQQSSRAAETAVVGDLTDRLRQEEDTAWAIFTPPNDVLGTSNADGHEVDFFVRDNKHASYFWSYTYDATSQTLRRYTYGAPGGTATLERSWSGIASFFAQTYPLTALQDSTSRIYSPLYAGATLQNGGVQFYSATAPWVQGGNSITYLRFATAHNTRELHLSTQTAPSGFTIVLNYTPAPAPSSTPAALNAWPRFVELPVNGAAVSTACAVNQARAFTDSTFATPLASTSAPAGALPAGVSGSTDGNGCITISDSIGSDVYLYEPGNTGALMQVSGVCGSAVKISDVIPGNESGPSVGLFAKGMTPTSACNMSWQDAAKTSATSVTFEVAGCTATSATTYTLIGLGSTCVAGSQWQSEMPDCTPAGSGGTYYGSISVSTTGPGFASDNGDGTITVERTAPGAVLATHAYYELVCDWQTHGTKRTNESVTYSFSG